MRKSTAAGAMITSAICAAVGLLVTGAGTAGAQQVCDASSLAGGEACFYSGPFLTGREFDLSVPLGQQLPVPGDGGCVDLPSGFGTYGSATNTSADTLYAFTTTCPDTRPGTRVVTVVPPRHTGNLAPSTGPWARQGIRSVRMCGPGLAIDPVALTCAYLR
ncbi:MAG TPA: hypothetical protein VFW65_15380 [Pseudonocardiaceae bacterium]|nr:hypothetical protein [Pseudonocardiaceae bacterium]